MAILKNLVVNGSARIINKLYCGELSVSGASTFGAITASSLSSTGTISATGNISSSGSVTGATGLVSTNGNVTLAGKVAASVSGNYLVLASGFSSGVQLNAKNLTTTGAINTGSIITNSAMIGNGVVSGKFIVNGVLESNEHIANIVRNVGGDLKLGPTFEAMNSTTLSVTAVTATTVSFTLYDTNITSATYGSATWYKNSEILFSGIVTGNINTSDNPKIVFSSAPGTVTARMNTTAKTLQIIVDYSDANQYFKVGNNLTYEDVSVMMYRINKDEAGTLYPIGIYLKSYGTNKESFVDVYGGTSQTPNARLGLLNGLSNMISGNTPSGWGVYTTNGFFEGVLVSTSGIIGGWEISNTRLKKGTLGSDNSIYVLTQDLSNAERVAIGGSEALTSWRMAVGSKFGIDKNGVVYASDGHFSGSINAQSGTIGGFTIGDDLSSGTWGASGSVLLSSGYDPDSSGISIGGSEATGNIWAITIGNNFGVTTDGVMYVSNGNFNGTMNANDGSIGGWNITANKLYNKSDSTYFLLQNPNIRFIEKSDISSWTSSVGTISYIGDNNDIKLTVNHSAQYASNANIKINPPDNDFFADGNNIQYRVVVNLISFHADGQYLGITVIPFGSQAVPRPTLYSLSDLRYNPKYDSASGLYFYNNKKTFEYTFSNSDGFKIGVSSDQSGSGLDFTCQFYVYKKNTSTGKEFLYAIVRQENNFTDDTIIGCEITENNVPKIPFYVESNGLLHTENLDAVGGTIGGWTINSNLLSSQNKYEDESGSATYSTMSIKAPSSFLPRFASNLLFFVTNNNIQPTVKIRYKWDGGERTVSISTSQELYGACPFNYSIWWKEGNGQSHNINSTTEVTSFTSTVGAASATGTVYLDITIEISSSALLCRGYNLYCYVYGSQPNDELTVDPYDVSMSPNVRTPLIYTLLPTTSAPSISTIAITDYNRTPSLYITSSGDLMAREISADGFVPREYIDDYNKAYPPIYGGFKIYRTNTSAINGPPDQVNNISKQEIFSIGIPSNYAQIARAGSYPDLPIDDAYPIQNRFYIRTMKYDQPYGSWTCMSDGRKLFPMSDTRLSSADNVNTSIGREACAKYFIATSAMTTGKPPIGDSHVLHFGWDTSGWWDTQVAFLNDGRNLTAKNAFAMRAGDGVNNVWCDWKTLLDLLYPVGSVYITSTNTNPSNNTLLGGGTWELVKKGFKVTDVTDAVTWDTTNVVASSGQSVFFLRDERISFRLRFTNKVAIADTTLTMGTINAAKIGLSGCYYISFFAVNDTANTAVAMDINNTAPFAIRTIDVVGGGTIAASTSTSPTITVEGEMLFGQGSMVDSMCDKFYWKRTA